MKPRKNIFLMCIPVVLLFLFSVVMGCSNGDGHNDASPQNYDEHLHDEDEVHDDHDHNLDDHDEAGHDAEHSASDDLAEEGLVHLTEAEMENIALEIREAQPGKLNIELSVQGEIRLNADRMANVVPHLTGIVRKITKSVGDAVVTGETMAIVESRELVDARSSLHASHERLVLAELNFQREEGLWNKKISSEQDYLLAKQELSEARIELESAKQKLLALGFPSNYVETLPHDPKEVIADLKITAPFSGRVIERNITLGELLKEDTVAFVVADLSAVWVDLSVHQKDLPFVNEGQGVVISLGGDIPDAEGHISYLSPVIAQETRTALARVVLPNPEGRFRPGLFITAVLTEAELPVSMMVPKSALQNLEGETVVFIKQGDGFKPQPVTTGRMSKTNAEVVSGLAPGQAFVAHGAFELKAKIVTSTMDSHAGHGH
jgi:cobalt-zinc-cadmium efflux system membrane fusion protein